MTALSYLPLRPGLPDDYLLDLEHTDFIKPIENTIWKYNCVRITRPIHIDPSFLPNLVTLYYDKSQSKNFKTNFKSHDNYIIKSKNHNKYYVLTLDFSNLDLAYCYFTDTLKVRLLHSIKTFIEGSSLTKYSSALRRDINSLFNKLQKQTEEHEIIYDFLNFIHKRTRQKLVVYIDEGTTLNVGENDFIRPLDRIYRVLFNQLTPDGCIHKIVASDIKSDHCNFISSEYCIFKNITQSPEVKRSFKFSENEVRQLIQQYHLADSEQAIDHIKADIIKFLKHLPKSYSNHHFNPQATLFYLDHIALFKKPPEQFNENLVNKDIFSKPAFSYANPETLKPILFALLKKKTLSYIGQIGLYNGVSQGEMPTNSVLGHLYKDGLIVHPENHRYRLMPADEKAAQQLLLLFCSL